MPRGLVQRLQVLALQVLAFPVRALLQVLAVLMVAPFTATPGLAGGPEWTVPDAQLTPMGWPEVEGWREDRHGIAFDAFLGSCRAIARRARPPRPAREMDAALAAICAEALALGPATDPEAREFFENRFQPVLITRHGQSEGFLKIGRAHV